MACIPKDARWYLADVVLEHAVEGDPRSVVHINIHLIDAQSPKRAYEKAIALRHASEKVYANPDGREVRVTFRGLRDHSLAAATQDEALDLLRRAKARAGFAPDEPFTSCERASVARRAIRRALLALGLLFVRRVAN